MKINKVLKHGIVLIVMILCSCSTNNYVLRKLGNNKFNLNYISDSKLNSVKKNVSIQLDLDTAIGLSNNNQVKNISKYCLPFILFSAWGNTKYCSLGKESFKQNPIQSFQNLFVKEAERSADFKVNDFSENTNKYQLKVKISEISTSGLFQSDGMFLFLILAYSYNYNKSCGASKANLKVVYTLSKNDQLVFSDTLVSSNKTDFIVKNYKDDSKLLKDFGTNMTECLSNSYKDVIEKIILKINSKLEN